MEKDQFVIACLENSATADIVLPWARHCAEKLKKGLILLNVSDDGQNDWLKQYGLPYIGLKRDWKTAIDGLPTDFGGVLAVSATDPSASRRSLAHPSTLLRSFRDCKIAYLAVGSQPVKTDTATLTIDHRHESKEKLIWASYMVRFFGSNLHVVAPRYKDQGLLQRQRNNLRFMEKIYASLEIEYSVDTPSINNFQNPDQLAIETTRPDILVAMTTDQRDRDMGDMIMGTPERRLLSHPMCPPLLLLNHRDDLYVLCD